MQTWHSSAIEFNYCTNVPIYIPKQENRKTTGQGNRFREEHNKLALNVCGDGLECLNQHQQD